MVTNQPYLDFSQNKFRGALALERIFSRKTRARLGAILNIGILLTLLLSIYTAGVSFLAKVSSLTLPHPSFFLSLGFLFLIFSPRLFLLALDLFWNSKTFKKTGDLENNNLAERFNFYASEIWYRSVVVEGGSNIADIFAELIKTSCGKITLLRLGVTSEIHSNLEQIMRGNPGGPAPLSVFIDAILKSSKERRDITFTVIFTALCEISEPVKKHFTERKIRQDTIEKTALWIERELEREDRHRRWWLKDELGRVPGIGKSWAYGKAPLLEKYAIELVSVPKEKEEELVGHEQEIQLLETALLKKSGANVILVGEPGAGRHTVLLGLVDMIAKGRVFPELEYKRVYQFYAEGAIASGQTKGAIEKLLLAIFKEAVIAGNIIFVIDDFAEFVRSLSSLGISAGELLSPHLGNPEIHIVALTDPITFRNVLENNTSLMHHFEKIEVNEPNENKILQILENILLKIEGERSNRAFITYPALEKISEGAIRYLVTGALPKRAVDLMEEILDEAIAHDLMVITPDFVLEYIGRKTKIPLGEITEEERKKLLDLEDTLHKRIINQEDAIGAIADAIRRARLEIRNPKRPIGTFLFLGPTGVGKTETAKALAEVYFGNENMMMRFDMTEYQTEDSIERLIGSSSRNEPGILASKMRSTPYSVVLLDEFEKTNQEVKNLFLQILDEGFFSDYLGQRINMRNTIIVATSNAGSQMIWELVRSGANPSKMKDEIISYVQKERILSPELLNRFDAIIVFQPLNIEVLKKIARLMLIKLAFRLKEQNLFFNITDELIDAVAKGGYSPEFGARPMQRFIQDHIEKIIADKMIRGEITPGIEFHLQPHELNF